MIASLELNWLSRSEKSLILPVVVFTEKVTSYGGMYHTPRKGEVLIQEKYYPLDKGLIEISTHFNDDANSIAHEFRHHWQFLNGWKLQDGIPWDFSFSPENYERNIKLYFTSSKSEMDAFLFQCKMTKSYTNDYWKSLIFS